MSPFHKDIEEVKNFGDIDDTKRSRAATHYEINSRKKVRT